MRARYSWPRCLAPVYRKLFTSPAGMCIFYISDFQESYGLSGGTSYGTDSDVCAPAGPSLATHGDRAGASPLACVHASAREGGLRSGGRAEADAWAAVDRVLPRRGCHLRADVLGGVPLSPQRDPKPSL